MVKLNNTKLPASTLVETTIAFVVIITIFTLSLSLMLQIYGSFQKISNFNSGYLLIETSWSEFADDKRFEKKLINFKGWSIETDTIYSAFSPLIYKIECTAYKNERNALRKISIFRLRTCSSTSDPLTQ